MTPEVIKAEEITQSPSYTYRLKSTEVNGYCDSLEALRQSIYCILSTDRYDYIILDCPPSLSMLTVNAMTAADTVLVPIQCEYYALEGLTQLIHTINLVKKKA